MTPINEDRLIQLTEVSKIVSMSKRHIDRLVAANKFPKKIKIGKKTLFSYNEIQDYIELVKQTRST